MPGTIVQINVSEGGLPKRPVAQARIGAAGLEGDRQAHSGIHGGARKAVLLIAAEVVDELAARGYPVFYGALGENLTMRGIDVRGLRIGDRMRAGTATIEITQLQRWAIAARRAGDAAGSTRAWSKRARWRRAI